MTKLGYERVPGSGLYLPVQGPVDERSQNKVKIPVKNDRCFPGGAIIMWGAAIGMTREAADKWFRDRGYDPEFVEVTE